MIETGIVTLDHDVSFVVNEIRQAFWQEHVLQKVIDGLSPGSFAIFTLGGTKGPSETLDSRMGPPMYHGTLGIARTLEVISAADAACRHLEYDQDPELQDYIICQRKDCAAQH